VAIFVISIATRSFSRWAKVYDYLYGLRWYGACITRYVPRQPHVHYHALSFRSDHSAPANKDFLPWLKAGDSWPNSPSESFWICLAIANDPGSRYRRRFGCLLLELMLALVNTRQSPSSRRLPGDLPQPQVPSWCSERYAASDLPALGLKSLQALRESGMFLAPRLFGVEF